MLCLSVGSSQKIGAPRKSEAQKEGIGHLLESSPDNMSCLDIDHYENAGDYFLEPSNEKPSTFDIRHYGQADAIDDVPEYSASGLAKWRLGIRQTKVENLYYVNSQFDEDILHKPVEQTNDILDISSGLLHISGDSLVPELIDKDCLHNARVLYQLDKKFIPVMANGRLMIIDQSFTFDLSVFFEGSGRNGILSVDTLHAADERIRVEELRRQVAVVPTYYHAKLTGNKEEGEEEENLEISSLDSSPADDFFSPRGEKKHFLALGEGMRRLCLVRIARYRVSYHTELSSVCRNLNLLKRHSSGVTLVAVSSLPLSYACL
ncbi:hypothetical protein BHM03_00022794 [Ensete ventricosum]|uniref:Uncharacterized protein n=1 Tax=Ensete ventricosum TaxID=4639 RepID=A0A445MGC0_ENSVE|nr:hypothetical protein BHM03_00022794 [Ensete ventricosum]